MVTSQTMTTHADYLKALHENFGPVGPERVLMNAPTAHKLREELAGSELPPGGVNSAISGVPVFQDDEMPDGAIDVIVGAHRTRLVGAPSVDKPEWMLDPMALLKDELLEKAAELGIEVNSSMTKPEIVDALTAYHTELMPDGDDDHAEDEAENPGAGDEEE